MGTDNWIDVRSHFNLDPDFSHFSTFWLSSHPREVREAIELHRTGLDRHPYRYVVENQDRLEELAASSIASFIGGQSDEIVVTHSTTEGLAIIYGGVDLKPGDEVLSSVHDHYSTFSTLNLLAARTGAVVRRIRLYEDGHEPDVHSIVDNVTASITDRTRLVALTWVHSSTGCRLPIQEIGRRIALENLSRSEKQRILFSVDGTHALGVFQIDVEKVACDFLIAACHKWLYGPRGTAFIWGRKESLNGVKELIPSFAPGPLGTFTGKSNSDSFGPSERLRPGGFDCFEHRWSIPAAIGFIAGVGTAEIYRRLDQLTGQLQDELSKIAGVRVITPRDPLGRGAIICFEVPGMTPAAIVSRLLERRIIASVSPYSIPFARLTPGIYNSEEDVIRAVEAVREIVNIG
jgi:isopenicillin-N epimerase